MAIVKVEGLSTSNIVYVTADSGDVVVLAGKDVTVKRDGFPVDTCSNETETAFYVTSKSYKYSTASGDFYVTIDGETSEYIQVEDYLQIPHYSPIDRVIRRDLEDFQGGGSDFDPTQYYTKSDADGKFQPKGDYASTTLVSTLEGKVSTLEGDNAKLKSDLQSLADRVTALEGAGA